MTKLPEMEIRDQLRDKSISSHKTALAPEGVKYDSVQRAKWTIGAVREQAQMLVKR